MKYDIETVNLCLVLLVSNTLSCWNNDFFSKNHVTKLILIGPAQILAGAAIL